MTVSTRANGWEPDTDRKGLADTCEAATNVEGELAALGRDVEHDIVEWPPLAENYRTGSATASRTKSSETNYIGLVSRYLAGNLS